MPSGSARRVSDLSRLFADLVEVLEPTLDPPAIGKRIFKLLGEALAIDFVAVYLARPDGELYVAEGTFVHEIPPDQRRLAADDPLVARLRAARRPLRIPPSEHANPAAVKLLIARGIERLVLAPIVAGERLLGIFVCSRAGDPDMTDLSDELFHGLGRVVGVALEHSRLLTETRGRAAADRALLEAVRAASTGAEMRTVLEKYAEALARAAGAESSVIVLPDPDVAEGIRIEATFGLSAEMDAAARATAGPAGPVVRRIYAERRLERFETASLPDGPGRRFLEASGIERFFAFPLVAHDSVHGVAFLSGPVSLVGDARLVLEAIGHEIALAIEGARERASARRQATRESAQEELRHTVRVSFDLAAILQSAVEKVGKALGAARCYVGVPVPGRPAVRRVTNEWRSRHDLAPAVEWKLDGGDRPIARAMAKTGEAVCDDVLTDPRFGSIESNAPADLRSFIITSIIEGDFSKGFICVAETDRPRRWQPEEIRFVRAVADHCAIAVRRAELHEDARRRATELELTVSQMTDAVILCNERLEVVRMNSAMKELCWDLPLFPTTSVRDGARIALHDLDGRELAPEEFPLVRAVREGEIIRDRELVLRLHPEGRERSVIASASPIRDGSGRLVGGVVVMKDVTQARAAAAAAGRTEKLRVVGELAASVAHDINNTLAAVLGSAELIATLSNQPDVVRHADVIAQGARDASVILGRLTRLSQRSRAASPRAPVDLARVAEDAVELTRPRWTNAGRPIVVVLDATEPVPVLGVASELREVLTNVILNAVDALPRGGKIVVRAERTGDDALVSIADDGVGMSDEVLAHAFEPFFTTKGELGTGLGLSISAAIIEGHGGRIDIDSKIGAGTTITIRIPRAAETPAPLRAPAGRHVLVVDDDARVRSLVVGLLAADGHQVVAAASGEEALRVVASDEPLDLLVTDFLMPGMSGLALAQEARARRPRLGIVVVSGFCGDESSEDLARIGARVVTKPFGADDVRAAAAAALDLALSSPSGG
ncbi:MAG TPA: GAF domain-containing protein [Planctomycetota bacterium]|nr:GAF domain-containing protein [Planctomycetota bacterium]